MSVEAQRDVDEPTRGGAGASDVFVAFLKLGLTSFGGPTAHIGYFRNELVVRRRWMSEEAYADIVTLCQLLPGPTSSQVGFVIGRQRAGALGGLAAFAGFTAPSAIIMFAFAAGLGFTTGPIGAALAHGLMLVAVSVVAHAVLGMARAFCRTVATAAIGSVALAITLATSVAWIQPLVIVGGGLAGLVLVRKQARGPAAASDDRGAQGFVLPAVFVLLFAALPVLAATFDLGWLAIADAFYRAGAFVFGGGHIVLPLLEAETVGRGWLDQETFLAGYGVAQAIPGPLFTFAGYIGAVSDAGVPPAIAGPLALGAIFLPGLLLAASAVPVWARLRNLRRASAFAGGANAAVVGLLGAALWDPVMRSAVLAPSDVVIAGLGFVLLQVRRVPTLLVIGLIVAMSLAATLIA